MAATAAILIFCDDYSSRTKSGWVMWFSPKGSVYFKSLRFWIPTIFKMASMESSVKHVSLQNYNFVENGRILTTFGMWIHMDVLRDFMLFSFV